MTMRRTYGGSVTALRSEDFFNFKKIEPNSTLPLTGTSLVNDRLYGTLEQIFSATVPFNKVFVSDPTVANSYGYDTPRCICIPFSVRYETPTRNVTISLPLSRFSLLRQMIFDYDSKPRVGLAIYEGAAKTKLWSAPLNMANIKDEVLTFNVDLGKSVSTFTLVMIIEFPKEINSKNYIHSFYEPGSSINILAGLTQDFVNQLNSSPITVVYRSDSWTKPASANCPFYTVNESKLPPIPLSALPFRAYEAYYNAFVS